MVQRARVKDITKGQAAVTEKKIQTAFLALLRQKGSLGLKPGNISRKAGLAKSTFYRHHSDIRSLAIWIELQTGREYAALLRRVKKRGGNLKDLIIVTLDFVQKHEDLFFTATKNGYMGPFRRIGREMWKYARQEGNSYEKAMKKIAEVYEYEVAAVIARWLKREETRVEAERDLIKLSKGGARRLNFMVE